MAQRLDDRWRLAGEAKPLVEAVLPNLTARPASAFSVARTGALVYQTAQGYGGARLVWSTRQGVHTMIADEPMVFRDLQLSPDGVRLSYSPLDATGRTDIWVLNLVRGVRTRLTFTGTGQMAAWSPDSQSLIFNYGTPPALVRKTVDGAAGEQTVSAADTDPKMPIDWSADGRTLLYETFSPQASNDLWALPLDGPGKPLPVANTRFSERWPQFSPDGKFIAYTSDESGTREVYVIRFGGTGRWLVSPAGGSYPRWSRKGDDLFFATPNGKISVVSVKVVGDAIETGPATPLFDARPPSGFARYFYDVAPDGRFLLSVPVAATETSALTLFVNWPAALEGR
jgi:Tol biopolymer transport system component